MDRVTIIAHVLVTIGWGAGYEHKTTATLSLTVNAGDVVNLSRLRTYVRDVAISRVWMQTLALDTRDVNIRLDNMHYVVVDAVYLYKRTRKNRKVEIFSESLNNYKEY